MTETGDQQGGALPPQHFIPPARLLFSETLAERNARSTRSAAAKSNPYWSEPPELRPSAPRRRGFLIEPPQPPAPSPAAGLAFLKGPRRHPDSQKAALCRSAWKGSHGPESSAPLRIKTVAAGFWRRGLSRGQWLHLLKSRPQVSGAVSRLTVRGKGDCLTANNNS